MITSENGISLIKQFEGFRLSAYMDSVGVPTIGFGSTHGVHMGMVISLAQADAMMRADLRSFESYVTAVVKRPIDQRMYDALVSFTYNLGQGNLLKSSLLRSLNAGDLHGAADGFLLWNRAGGIVSAGLVRRRGMERAMFLAGVLALEAASDPAAAKVQPDAPQDDETPVEDAEAVQEAGQAGSDDPTDIAPLVPTTFT